MVSFRPISRSLPLASSRAALFTSRVSPLSRCASSRAYSLVASPKPAFSTPRFAPSSIRSLTTTREKVKVLLVLYDGGQHAKDVRLPPVP